MNHNPASNSNLAPTPTPTPNAAPNPTPTLNPLFFVSNN